MKEKQFSKIKLIWKDHRVWIIPGGALLVLGIGYALLRRKKNRNDKDGVFHPSAGASGFRCKSTSYPLSYGTCHGDVAILQNYLLKRGYDLGETGEKKNGVDGQFGEKTKKAALSAFGRTTFSRADVKNMKATRMRKYITTTIRR